MNILRLTLKKKWFDMIYSGEKPEEYREDKQYWRDRLMHFDWVERNSFAAYKNYTDFKHYDAIEFTNGYGAHMPSFLIECKGIELRTGNEKWGAFPNTVHIVIKLGKVLSSKNILPTK